MGIWFFTALPVSPARRQHTTRRVPKGVLPVGSCFLLKALRFLILPQLSNLPPAKRL
jgi:hypothetical protein